MNFVFIGSSNFGFRCLQASIELPSVNIVGIVTAPQTFAISYRPQGVHNVLHADISKFAEQMCIPVCTLNRSMNEPTLLESVLRWRPDAFLVVGWYHMIPRKWRDIAPAYGLHASLLPDYSGGAPLVWAMINRECKTGITFFQMDDGVDSGPIVAQKEVLISSEDTIKSLYARVEESGIDLLSEFLPQLANGSLKLHTQNEALRRIYPQRGPEDGLIHWAESAESIVWFIRAQTRPYPGAFTYYKGQMLHIWSASLSEGVICDNKPGTIFESAKENYMIVCGSGYITIKEVSYQGKDFSGTRLAILFGKGGHYLSETPNF